MSRRASSTASSSENVNSDGAEAKRSRKPTSRYVEDSSWEVVKKLSQQAVPNARKKSAFVEGGSQRKDKWYRYKSKISQLARAILKDQHTVDAYDVDDRDIRSSTIPLEEVAKCNARIVSNKKAILATLDDLEAEHADHRRWEKLRADYDDDDSVDVEDIMCSLCLKPDEEGNDIVFCDRTNCLRAYHQRCLDPPVLDEETDPDSAWFCRQCACIDDCLDLVGELLGTDCDHHSQLFPELRDPATGEAQVVEEDSEEEDADYTPSHSGSGDDDEVEEEEGDSAEGSDESDGSEESGAGDDGVDREGTEGSESNDGGEEGSQQSDDTSDIDDDEVQGLLMDANLSSEQVVGALHTRQLRPRRGAGSSASVDRTLLPEGAADVGKEVAVVRTGRLVVGTILAYRSDATAPSAIDGVGNGSSSSSSSSSNSGTGGPGGADQELQLKEGVWVVQFEGDNAHTEVNLETIRKYLQLYGEYRARQSADGSSSSAYSAQRDLVEEQGKLDAANVLTYKRARQPTDYAALSRAMFGDEADKDTDDDDPPFRGSRHSTGTGSSSNGNSGDEGPGDGAAASPGLHRDSSDDDSSDSGDRNLLLASHRLDHDGDDQGSGAFGLSPDELGGKRKRGRPLGRKDTRLPDGSTFSGRKRGRPVGSRDTRERVRRSDAPLGRPRKTPLLVPPLQQRMGYDNSDSDGGDGESGNGSSSGAPCSEPRKRGRPRKTPLDPNSESSPKRKRGRPRIHPVREGERKRGRPKGSKNKPKPVDQETENLLAVAHTLLAACAGPEERVDAD